jgi:hypothetical protein
VNATTVPGENIYIVGAVDALSNWGTDRAVALDGSKYPIWSVTVKIPVDVQVQYKYIRKTPPSEEVTWQADPNNLVNVPASGTLVVNDTWKSK